VLTFFAGPNPLKTPEIINHLTSRITPHSVKYAYP
jgi:hypothetical protein